MSVIENIKNFNTLKKNLKKDLSGLKEIKVAIIGDTSTQLLNQCLKAYGIEESVHFVIYEADYNQVDAQILDLSSELYQFRPEFVIIFQSTQKLSKKFLHADRTHFSEQLINSVRNYYDNLTNQVGAKVIYFNFAEINDSVFGNYGNKTSSSFIYQLRSINFGLMELAAEKNNLFIVDHASLHSQLGRSQAFDLKMYYSSDMVLSIDILPLVAKNLTDMILSINGRFKKCLITDLDNTLWGGIIGDDGVENIQVGDLGLGKAFTDLQTWMKQLKERGIILAVCSKNNEDTAKEPFEKHPEMALRLDDFAVFVANWNNKADNIRHIQSILNIGFDSMVFIDDNPAERELVRNNLPQVLVPEMPEDPAFYLDHLQRLNLFETASFSKEDQERTKLYQEEAGRAMAMKNFTNEDDFLKSLEMSSQVRPFDKFNTPRVAQLSQRSNQFNLRTVRYTEQDVSERAASDKYRTLTFNLKDKFGDNGLICIVVLEKRQNHFFIENWFMSCRVLKRGMENFTMNMIVKIAKENGISAIIGEYIPSAKNSMVKDHYRDLGFVQKGNEWHLDVNKYTELKNFIIAC